MARLEVKKINNFITRIGNKIIITRRRKCQCGTVEYGGYKAVPLTWSDKGGMTFEIFYGKKHIGFCQKGRSGRVFNADISVENNVDLVIKLIQKIEQRCKIFI